MVGWALRAYDHLADLSDLRQRMFTGYHLTLAFVNGGVPGFAAALIEQLGGGVTRRSAAESGRKGRRAGRESAEPVDGVSSEARLTWRLAEAVYHWNVGDPGRCLAAVADGSAVLVARADHVADS